MANNDPTVPRLPSINAAVDGLGNWLTEIDRYLKLIETIEPKLTVAESAYGAVEPLVKSIVLIPGTGEFVYDPEEVRRRFFESAPDFDDNIKGTPFEPINRFNGSSDTDVVAALDDLQSKYPNITYISLVVSWMGNDLRAGNCLIRPQVEDKSVVYKDGGFWGGGGDFIAAIDTAPYHWSVQGLSRLDVPLTSREGGGFIGNIAYSSTPADRSVVKLIQEIHRRNLKVTFYPFILMDVPPGNGKPDPYGGSEQPAFPWRGRISCHPAPGQPGSPDRSATARTQLQTLIGSCNRTDFTQRAASFDVTYSGPNEWSFRRFILHYAHLCAVAGGVDAFLIGSELRGLTWVRDEADRHPFVEALVGVANDVRAILPSTKISYAADWSEFTPYQTPEGNLDFHLDPLWASTSIDALGIDNYWPLSDWRGVTGIDEDEYPNIYDPVYLASNIEGGEGYDFFYASEDDRINQVRTPITDGLGKPWVYRYKDVRNWWLNQHFNRTGGTESAVQTAWVPQSKPIWMTEIGCPAIDKGTNQPNVFVDPKSSESFFPYFSFGTRDDLIQRRHIAALHTHYASDAKNPASAVYGGRMVDRDRLYIYCWDARPYPTFPDRIDVWGDGPNWERGHWITGRPVTFPQPPLPSDPGTEVDLMPAKPMPKGEPAVDPKTGQLNPAMHHYLAQIEQIARRLQNLQIVAVTDGER